MRALLIPLTCSALAAADLPVKRVVLYKHGVGFFERDGIVRGDEDIRLNLDQNEMNDVLKSLTVSDDGHGTVQGVRY